MKLANVSLGNMTGRQVTCRLYCGGYSVGQVYQILEHRMDEGSFGYPHYYLLESDNGDKKWVPANLFR